MAVVQLPDMLVKLLKRPRTIEVAGATLAEAMDDLFLREPTLRQHVLDEDGILRRYLLLLHGDAFIRRGDTLDTPVGPDDTIRIMHSMAGG